MKKLGFILAGVAVLAVVAFYAQDAMASAPEERVLSLVERLLNLFADFFAKVFHSFADAVKSVWSPGGEGA